MSMIHVLNLTFAYDGSYDTIFEDVSFQLDTDWKLGFIGRNGRGKTTFLNLLQGKYPYQGTISSHVDFLYFPFTVRDDSLMTIEIAWEICPDLEYWCLAKELAALKVSDDVIYRPFSTLSHGERTKVMLGILFLRDHAFLLIDEPTNHLDTQGRKIIGEYLSRKKGFILVSHDRSLLDTCVDHVLSLNRQTIEVQKGNFSSWWENRSRQEQFERAEEEKLKKDIKRLSEAAKRTAVWSEKVEASKFATKNSGLKPDRGFIGHKSTKMMKRSQLIAQRRETMAEEKSKLLKNAEKKEDLKIPVQKYHNGQLLALDHVNIFYGEKNVCSDITFSLQREQIVALSGKNGCGKSSILKLIMGENIPHSGVLYLGSGLKISYVPQDCSFLKGSLSSFAKEHAIDETLFKTILRKLDFGRQQFEKDMSDFSAGQKKKVMVACSLCERAHLYIWDEPLNYIDVFSRMQIEDLICRFQPTMLLVEHDDMFKQKIRAADVVIGISQPKENTI